MHTPGGKQTVLFLTERGLYRLLFTSRAVCHEMQASHKMLHAATLANSVYKDFRWNVV